MTDSSTTSDHGSPAPTLQEERASLAPTLRDESLELQQTLSKENKCIDKEKVLEVHAKVWDEFYLWEQVYCAAMIASLDCDNPTLSSILSAETKVHDGTRSAKDFFSMEWNTPRADAPDRMLVKRENTQKFESSSAVTFIAPHIQPSPVYEACTPSNINLAPRYYAVPEHEVLNFIPYIDDPAFDIDGYVAQFEDLAWVTDNKDPDRECEFL